MHSVHAILYRHMLKKHKKASEESTYWTSPKPLPGLKRGCWPTVGVILPRNKVGSGAQLRYHE